MDIIIDFGSIVVGSNPAGCTLDFCIFLVYLSKRDHSLVVERVVANDWAGVRFPMIAPNNICLLDISQIMLEKNPYLYTNCG